MVRFLFVLYIYFLKKKIKLNNNVNSDEIYSNRDIKDINKKLEEKDKLQDENKKLEEEKEKLQNVNQLY